MNTVELFAGIGGFRIAADQFGLTTVFANDIDGNAVKVYKSVWGDESIVEGDIHDYLDSIPEHDVLTGGFPCQPFSKAGKKRGIDDYRGTLFESIIYIVEHRQPKYFILENVNSLLYMNHGRHFQIILAALSDLDYKIEWKVFNAEQFGLPQHRQRLIIVGTYQMRPEESYFFDTEDEDNTDPVTFHAIADYSQWKEIGDGKKFDNWGMAFHGKYCSAPVLEKQYVQRRILADVLQDSVDESFDFTVDTLERIKKSEYVNRYYNGVQILYNQGGGARMGYSIFGTDGIAPTLTASTSRHYERYKIGDRFRRLTNVEYARLQGFDDDHCAMLTPYNQYKYYGNAVPPQIIRHVFNIVLNGRFRLLEKNQQTLFDLWGDCNMNQQEYKNLVRNNLPLIQAKLNELLTGKCLAEIESIMKRFDKNGKVPEWFELLQIEHRLPNLDGKTVGSVIEKLLVCVLEKYVLHSEIQLSINPARGVDIPELELGIKSPSTNFDTSEPYFSAYERLLGNEYDAVILLTNYQEAKKVNPFMLQILQVKYLTGSEIADSNLCMLAKELRLKYGDTQELQKAVRFLSYVNHSDWEANWILKLLNEVIVNKKKLVDFLPLIKRDFEAKNRKKVKENKELIPDDSLYRLESLIDISPEEHSIINTADNWVIRTQKDNGRFPNENEWRRFLQGPLDGKISMSFALQWRYNFRCLFCGTVVEEE